MKTIFECVLVEPLLQLSIKPKFVKEKWKPQASHLPLKKRLIYRLETGGYNNVQENNNATSEVIYQTSSAESPIRLTKDTSTTPATPKRGVSMNLATPSPTLDGDERTLAPSSPSILQSERPSKGGIIDSPKEMDENQHSSQDELSPLLEKHLESKSLVKSTKAPLNDGTMLSEDEATNPSSSSSKPSSKPKKHSNVSLVASAIVASTLASNASSHPSFRPKRRSHHAPTNIQIYPPLKRESNVSFFTSSSLSEPKKASTSGVKCASNPSFPKILSKLSFESCLEPSSLMKNATKTGKLSMSNIFTSSKKSSSTFHKILEEKEIIAPTHHSSHAPSTSTHDALSDEEPNVSFSPLPSEPRHSSTTHISSHETEGNSCSSETLSLSSHSSSTSRLHPAFGSKFAHLKNSRFESASFIFRDRTLKSKELYHKTSEEHLSSSSSFILPKERKTPSSSISETCISNPRAHFSSSKSSNHPKEELLSSPTKSSPTLKTKLNILPLKPSSAHSSPTNEEETLHHSPSHLKKILGPTKTLDFSSHKIISERTLGAYKTFSSTHLGTSIYSKSKAKATKYLKSSFKIKSAKTSSSTCFSRPTSRIRDPTLARLGNGEQPLYSSNSVVSFIILLLLYLFLVKLMHLPFDRGKGLSFILPLK